MNTLIVVILMLQYGNQLLYMNGEFVEKYIYVIVIINYGYKTRCGVDVVMQCTYIRTSK